MNSSDLDFFDQSLSDNDQNEDDPTNSKIAILHRYATFICSLIMCVCCSIGVFGNSLSLLIFTRKCMRSPINVFLAGLSLVDLFVVVFAIPVFVTPGIGTFYYHSGSIDMADDPERAAAFGRFVDQLYTMIVFGIYQFNMIAQTCSVWTCVVICSERYVAVCRPFVAQRYSTVNRARAVQISVFVASIGYNFIRFFEYEPDSRTGGFRRRLRDDTLYIYIYYTILYLLTHFLVPFCFITATNVLILRAMRRAHNIRRLMTGTSGKLSLKQQQQKNVKSQRSPSLAMTSAGQLRKIGERRSSTSAVQQQQTSHVIVVVTIMFTLCNTLSFVISIWEAFQLDLFSGKAAVAAFLLLDLSNVLVVFNSATTFLFYLRYCTKYRKLFLFYCSKMAAKTGCGRKFMNRRTTQQSSEMSANGSGSTLKNRKGGGSDLLPRRSNRPELNEMITPSCSNNNKRRQFTNRQLSYDEPDSVRPLYYSLL